MTAKCDLLEKLIKNKYNTKQFIDIFRKINQPSNYVNISIALMILVNKKSFNIQRGHKMWFACLLFPSRQQLMLVPLVTEFRCTLIIFSNCSHAWMWWRWFRNMIYLIHHLTLKALTHVCCVCCQVQVFNQENYLNSISISFIATNTQ